MTIARRINAERLALFGWSRAILLQLAHPLVAAGVAGHSSFRRGHLTTAVRLHHTVRAMLALTYGGGQARTTALEGIRDIHRRVRGRLPVAAGIFPAGAPYSAEDPELVLWVHATLLESIPMAYERLVQPLTTLERDAYCAEAAGTAIDLGARDEDVPRTWAAMTAYMDSMYESGRVAVSAQARELAASVLSPPFATILAPVTFINRLVTIGLLPPAVRGEYGFEWSPAHDRRLDRVCRRLRTCRGLMPPWIALWPEARRAG